MEEKPKKSLKNQSGWIVLSVAFAVLVTASFFGSSITGFVTADASGEVAANRVISLLEIDSPGINAEIESITKESGFYIVEINIDGQVVPFYTSIDGKYLIYDVDTFDDIEEYVKQLQAQETAQEEVTSYSSGDLDDFVTCLADSGVKIYGANWCGYTTSLVNNLGGYQTIESIYVECTVDQETCAEQQVTGYPTIKINGETVNVERTVQGFATATGCPAPNVGVQQTTNPDTGC